MGFGMQDLVGFKDENGDSTFYFSGFMLLVFLHVYYRLYVRPSLYVMVCVWGVTRFLNKGHLFGGLKL